MFARLVPENKSGAVTALTLVANVMAAKRISRLVVEDHILDDARNAWFEKHPPHQDKLGFLITCHACMTIWAGAFISSGFLPKVLRDTLALSELALIAQRLTRD